MYHPRFKGDHYQIGLKYGGLLKKNNIELFGLNELDDFQLNYGVQSEKVLRKYFPEACDEMKGMADGLGVPYRNLLGLADVHQCMFGSAGLLYGRFFEG